MVCFGRSKSKKIRAHSRQALAPISKCTYLVLHIHIYRFAYSLTEYTMSRAIEAEAPHSGTVRDTDLLAYVWLY
jgi:hypothetical protein